MHIATKIGTQSARVHAVTVAVMLAWCMACSDLPQPAANTTDISQRTGAAISDVTPIPEYDGSDDIRDAGVALYTHACAGCHQPLERSTKLSRTSEQIVAALASNPVMNKVAFLQTLTLDNIKAIAAALAPVTPEEQKRKEELKKAFIAGAALYESTCSSCHGPLKSSSKTDKTAAQIQKALLEIQPMASVKVRNEDVELIARALKSSVITAMSAFVRGDLQTEQTRTAISSDPSSGSTQQNLDGIALYNQNCSGCHLDYAHTLKRGRTAQNIVDAIQNISYMSALATLNRAIIDAIATALVNTGVTATSTMTATATNTTAAGYSTGGSSSATSTPTRTSTSATLIPTLTATAGSSPGSSPTANPTASPTVQAANLTPTSFASATPTSGQPIGAELYASNCQSCHGTLVNSQKSGKTAVQISTAIASIGLMAGLGSLTFSDILAISNALGGDNSVPNSGTNSNSESILTEYNGAKFALSDRSVCAANDPHWGNAESGLTRKRSMQFKAQAKMLIWVSLDSHVDSAFTKLLPENIVNFGNEISNDFTPAITPALLDFVTAISNKYADLIMSGVVSYCALTNGSMTAAVAKACITRTAKELWYRTISTQEQTFYYNIFAAQANQREGVKVFTAAMLLAPESLLNQERDNAAQNAGTFPLSPREIMMRLTLRVTGNVRTYTDHLNYSAGKFADPTQIPSMIKGMLESPYSGKLRLHEFFGFLIGGRSITGANQFAGSSQYVLPINANRFDEDFAKEFFDYIDYMVFQTNGTFRDLMSSTVAFPTARMAPIFGSSTWNGDFTQPQNGPNHVGLINRPYALMSSTDGTSPILRGVNLMRKFLCEDLPSPDATIIGSRFQIAGDPLHMSARDYVTTLTSPPQCQSCHDAINKYGFAFASFDGIGRYVTMDRIFSNRVMVGSYPVVSAVTNAKVDFSSYVNLANSNELAVALSTSRQAQQCFVRQMIRFYFSRLETEEDACLIAEITNQLSNGVPLETAFINFFNLSLRARAGDVGGN